MHTTSDSVKVLVSDRYLPAADVRLHPERFSALIRQAKADHGHALCLCREPGLKLVVRELSDKLILAAWPDSGHLHAVGCPYYSELNHLSRASSRRLKTTTTGSQVSYASPLSYDGRLPIEARPRPDSAPDVVRLWGLLHHLWEICGLNRWQSGWKRDWGFVRHTLTKHAAHVEINGEPLSLYVPRVFQDRTKAVAAQEWAQFTEPLMAHRRGQPVVRSAFMLGVVRSLTAMSYGYLVRLQHHANPILLPVNLAHNLAKMSRRGWSELIATGGSSSLGRVVAMFRVEFTNTGMVVAADCVLMRVHRLYLPSSNAMQDEVCEALVQTDSEFIRPLSYSQEQRGMPTYVLREPRGTTLRIVEMLCVAASVPAHLAQETIRDHVTRAASFKHDSWVWDQAKSRLMPPLPVSTEVAL